MIEAYIPSDFSKTAANAINIPKTIAASIVITINIPMLIKGAVNTAVKNVL